MAQSEMFGKDEVAGPDWDWGRTSFAIVFAGRSFPMTVSVR